MKSMQHLLLAAMFVVFCVALHCNAWAYDATYNFTQPSPELVSGFRAKAGATKGGPYIITVDCKKPPLKADGTYDCVVPDITFNPIYGVVSNYDGTGKEMAASAEATASITAPAPGNLKIVVTIRTVSSFTSRGNIIAKTTVTSKEVPAGTIVNTKPINYWNSKTKQYISQTTLVL